MRVPTRARSLLHVLALCLGAAALLGTASAQRTFVVVGVALRNNAGRVHLENLTGGGFDYTFSSIEASQCRSVHVAQSGPLIGTVRATDSTLMLVDCKITGGVPRGASVPRTRAA